MRDQPLPTTPGDWYAEDWRVLAPDPLIVQVPWQIATVTGILGYGDGGSQQAEANRAVLVNAAANYRALRAIVAVGTPLLDAPDGLLKPVETLKEVLRTLVETARRAAEVTEGT